MAGIAFLPLTTYILLMKLCETRSEEEPKSLSLHKFHMLHKKNLSI